MRVAAIAARTVRWPIAGTGAARGRGERAAVLVEVRTDRGAIGLGEAAPLPGMSPDALDDAEAAIAVFARLAGVELADREAARLLVAATTPPPSARFALETALFDALARELGVSLAALLRGPGEPRVPLSAVVDDPGSARTAFSAGIRCLKIKLAAGDSLDRVFAIADAAPGAALRIDANRSWPDAEVHDRLAALAALPLEYVEEPCRDTTRLLRGGPLPCRLALDESLVALPSDQLAAALASPALAAVILKPALLGGVSACLALAEQARAAGVAAVASHALEGPIGTAACAELALALASDGAPCPAAGLAPHPALAGWQLAVAQLAADHVRPAAAPGLGFVALDLAGALRACPEAR